MKALPDELSYHPIEYNQAFLTYLSCQGDLNRASMALLCDPVELGKLAEEHQWALRYERLMQIRADKGVEAMTRELNRTVNYVQAVQARQLVDRILSQWSDPIALENAMTIETKNGTMTSTKPVAELIKAMETAQKLTYMALGDMITEREASEERNAGQSAMAILRMLASKQGMHVESSQLMPPGTVEKHSKKAEKADANPRTDTDPDLNSRVDRQSALREALSRREVPDAPRPRARAAKGNRVGARDGAPPAGGGGQVDGNVVVGEHPRTPAQGEDVPEATAQAQAAAQPSGSGVVSAAPRVGPRFARDRKQAAA